MIELIVLSWILMLALGFLGGLAYKPIGELMAVAKKAVKAKKMAPMAGKKASAKKKTSKRK